MQMIPYALADEAGADPAIGQAQVTDEREYVHAPAIGCDQVLEFSQPIHGRYSWRPVCADPCRAWNAADKISSSDQCRDSQIVSAVPDRCHHAMPR